MTQQTESVQAKEAKMRGWDGGIRLVGRGGSGGREAVAWRVKR